MNSIDEKAKRKEKPKRGFRNRTYLKFGILAAVLVLGAAYFLAVNLMVCACQPPVPTPELMCGYTWGAPPGDFSEQLAKSLTEAGVTGSEVTAYSQGEDSFCTQNGVQVYTAAGVRITIILPGSAAETAETMGATIEQILTLMSFDAKRVPGHLEIQFKASEAGPVGWLMGGGSLHDAYEAGWHGADLFEAGRIKNEE